MALQLNTLGAHRNAFAGRTGGVRVDGSGNRFVVKDYREVAAFLEDVGKMSSKDYVQAFINRLATNKIPREMITTAAGFGDGSFTEKVIFPMVQTKIFAALTNNMSNNYRACRLLSIPLTPASLPQPKAEFKYVMETEEIPLAEEGGVRNITGLSIRNRSEMTVGLNSYSLSSIVTRSETIQQAFRDEVRAQVIETVNAAVAGWEANIALLHFRYAAGQPSMAELIALRNADYTADRDRVAGLLDMLNIENTIEAAINRDHNCFRQLIHAMILALPDDGNNHVVLLPKQLAMGCVNKTVRIKIPSKQMFYGSQNSLALDTGNHVIDMEWSRKAVEYQTSVELVQRSGTTAILDHCKTQAAIMDAEAPDSTVVLPALQIGETIIPIIALDDKPFGESKPSMQSPFVSANTKRLCYTVGAVPPAYKDLMHQGFYNGNSEISLKAVADKSARVTNIVNYDEQASVCEIRLSELHRYANDADSFSLVSYTLSQAGMPPLQDDIHGKHYTTLNTLFRTFKARTESQLSLYESNPRFSTFPSLVHTLGGWQCEQVRAPRICMGNASFMQGPETDLVSVLAGIRNYMPPSKALEDYIALIAQGFCNTSEDSIFWTVITRGFLALGINDLQLSQYFDDAYNHLVLNPNGAQNIIFLMGGNGAPFIAILKMLRHVVQTKGYTLCVADPFCAHVVITCIAYFQNLVTNHNNMHEIIRMFLTEEDMNTLGALRTLIITGQRDMISIVNSIPTLRPSLGHYNVTIHANCSPGLLRTANIVMNFFGGPFCNTELLIRGRDPALQVQGRGINFRFARHNMSCTVANRILFDPVSGEIINAGNQIPPNMYEILYQTYEDSIFCRSSSNFLTAVNEKLSGYNSNHVFPQGVDIVGHRMGYRLNVYDVSPVRFPKNQLEMTEAVTNIAVHSQNTHLYDSLYRGVMQPIWFVRQNLLREEMSKTPTNMFYMQCHYMTIYSYKTVHEFFDKHYHSGLSYLCVRTMQYDGLSMAALPMGGSFFATGNVSFHAANTQNYQQSLTTAIEMAVLPGHGPTHGVVMPNVFVTNITGVNSIFVDPDSKPRTDTRISREKHSSSLNHMTLVLDWYASLLPTTLNGQQKTCETALPMGGRYIPFNYQSADPYNELDYSGRYCESPTLLPYSESHARLARLAAAFDHRSEPIKSFLECASMDQISGQLMADILAGKNKDQALSNLLIKASNMRSIVTPFTTATGMMMFDSYVVGARAGIYLQQHYMGVSTDNAVNQALTPRILGDSFGPTNMFTPGTSNHFMANFCSLFNLPHQSTYINEFNTVSDMTALSGTK
ncbi:ORF54-like protein [Bufonid herpesvirus 1]|uniref:ORF54-like protein n=1 Tax=Bufonid herpesvirus 1 TaxID=2282206 RepID=UPI000EB6A49D|nr:ORF54-like protein [Bufonid herpesvirus 1]AXF48590.1 ORF54-like protein [Bufonid herpesvirus 1]